MRAKKNNKPGDAGIPAAPELEAKRAFDKDVFFRFSVREILVDILFVTFSFFISDSFFEESNFFTELKSWQVVAMYGVVVLTLPYYMGYIYERNKSYYTKPVMKVYLWIFILMTLMILINLMRLVFKIMGDSDNFLHDANGFTAAFSLFLLVLGPMMCIGGAMTAQSELQTKEGEELKFNPDRFAASGSFLLITLAVALMIYFIGLFPEGSGGWVVIVGYLGGPIAAVIIFGLFMGLLSLLDKMGVYKCLVVIAKTTFPFFIISVLVFWSGIIIHFMKTDFANPSGHLSVGAIIFSVCISGLIPFRIISILNPPWRLSNIIVGLLTMIWFFYRMVELTH